MSNPPDKKDNHTPSGSGQAVPSLRTPSPDISFLQYFSPSRISLFAPYVSRSPYGIYQCLSQDFVAPAERALPAYRTSAPLMPSFPGHVLQTPLGGDTSGDPRWNPRGDIRGDPWGNMRGHIREDGRRPCSVLSIDEILNRRNEPQTEARREGDFHYGQRTPRTSPQGLCPLGPSPLGLSPQSEGRVLRQQRLAERGHPYYPHNSPSRRSDTPARPSTDNRSSKDKSNKKAGNKGKRVRTIFTPEQLETLEKEFAHQQYMVGTERFYLAQHLHLREAQVKVWFQNRRIKWRKQNEKTEKVLYSKVDMFHGLDLGSDVDDDDDDDNSNDPKKSSSKNDGTTANSSGTTANSSGNTANSSGNTASSSGNTANSSGNTANSSGNTASSSGNTASSSGNTASSSGTTANSSGNTSRARGLNISPSTKQNHQNSPA